MVVKERLQGIALEYQSLQLIVDLLLFETVGKAGESLLEIQRRCINDLCVLAEETLVWC